MGERLGNKLKDEIRQVHGTEVGLSDSNALVISQQLKSVINDCINTAVGICNASDDKHVTDMAAHIADQLISNFTDVPDL